jgi:hypothetical protein
VEGRSQFKVFPPAPFHLPPSTWFGHQASALRFLLEISSGLKITTDDDGETPTLDEGFLDSSAITNWD